VKQIITWFLLSCLHGVFLTGQVPDFSDKRELLHNQILRTTADQDTILPERNEFVNGKLYYPLAHNLVHPFFEDNYWKNGKIWVSEKEYDVGFLKYDLVSANLVYLHHHNATVSPIYLNKELVKKFTMGPHHFIYLNDFEKTSNRSLKPGYYEIIYDGVTKFYIRREKTSALYRYIFDPAYTQSTYLVLYKQGEYLRIRGRLNFLNAFDDQKKEIRTYMRMNNLRFNTRNISFIEKVLDYYDNL
jgi:hypothetical protein